MFRVFGRNAKAPDLAKLLKHLHTNELRAEAHFRGDDLGWTGGELVLGNRSVTVERYLTKEDDLRDELNTWAGWLETQADQPRHGELMQHVIGTTQLVSLQPADAALEGLCDEVCRWLAGATDGIYQADGRGFLAADGTVLLHE